MCRLRLDGSTRLIMKYKFVLELELDRAEFYLADRNNHRLEFDTTTNGNSSTITTDIELPNRIKLIIENPVPDSSIKIIGASLGNLRFNKHKLGDLFVYHHCYGQNRNTTWDLGGLVEFEFFEYSAIKYHLIRGTLI